MTIWLCRWTGGAIETALRAAQLDWSEIDPSIFGTLFERGLNPDKRSQLGAHYTDRDKIMRIVEPVIIRPLLAEWEIEKEKIAAAIEKEDRKKTTRSSTRRRRSVKASPPQRQLNAFLKSLEDFTVLDPACGSGNFLYLALHALKDIEHRVQLEAESMGLQRSFPAVGPPNVRGIEINAYAAELARVSVWIGEIQWMRHNGYQEASNPILKPLDTIECRDAILALDGGEPDWPEADVVIGNPPFLGGKLLARGLGDGLRVQNVRGMDRTRAPGSRFSLLLVREGWPASRDWYHGSGRARCYKLDTRRCQSAGTTGRYGWAPDFRCMER